MRFGGNYLKYSSDFLGLGLAKTEDLANAFSYSPAENSFYFTVEVTDAEGLKTQIRYYLNFTEENGFYFSTEKATVIQVFRLSSGFSFELVEDVSQLEQNCDYVIIAKSGGKNYLLSEDTSVNTEDGTVTAKGTFGPDTVLTEMPAKWSLQEYLDNRNLIWYTSSATAGTNTATLTLYDKLSGRYYIATSNTEVGLILSTSRAEWTYTVSAGGGGTMQSGGKYLSFSQQQGSTGFTVSGSPYTVYLYRLVAEDTGSAYNTYQGARLVTSASSSVEEGRYILAAKNASGQYVGLIMNSSGSTAGVNVTGYIGQSGITDLTSVTGAYDGYKWIVSETSTTPSFSNERYFSYLAKNSTDTGISLQSGAFAWRYDAHAGRLYYTVTSGSGQVTATSYYLAHNGSNFVIVSDPSLAA